MDYDFARTRHAEDVGTIIAIDSPHALEGAQQPLSPTQHASQVE